MSDAVLIDFLVVAFAFIALGILYSRQRQKKLPFPPGPKRLPVVGNLFDMPAGSEWITYKQWGKLYGAFFFMSLGGPLLMPCFSHLGSDLLHVDVLGTHIVIINSVKTAIELLEKRSSVYSDR